MVGVIRVIRVVRVIRILRKLRVIRNKSLLWQHPVPIPSEQSVFLSSLSCIFHTQKNTFDLWAKILALIVVYLLLARHSKLAFSALASVVGSEKQKSFANMSIYKHFFYQMGAKTNKFI